MDGPILGYGDDYVPIPMPRKGRHQKLLDLLTPDQKLMLEQIEREEEEEERQWNLKREQQRAKDQASILTGVMDMFADHPLVKTAFDAMKDRGGYTGWMKIITPSVIAANPDLSAEEIVTKADLIVQHTMSFIDQEASN